MTKTSLDTRVAATPSEQCDPNDWIEVGCITKPHGIRGEVRVKLHNAQSQILYELDEVLLRGGASGALDRVGRICSARSAASGFVLVVFDGIDSRTLADGLRGALVCVPRDALPKVDDGEFYVHDIMGAQVVLVGGEPIGEVVDFISYPSTDVLVVKGSARYEIPMVDDFVRDVDAKNRVVIVDNVEDFRVD